MPCNTISVLQSDLLNPITKTFIVKALQDVCMSDDVTEEKINAGSEIYGKLVDGTKSWKSDVVSIEMDQSMVTNELESLRSQRNWSKEFCDMVQAFSTITAADAQCQGRLVTDGLSYIEVHAVASLKGDDGQRHMQIINSRHDLQMRPQIETIVVQHQNPVYKRVNRRRNRFLGIWVDHWQETKFSHNETVNETKTVEKPQTLTGRDFDNVKAFTLHQLCNGVV